MVTPRGKGRVSTTNSDNATSSRRNGSARSHSKDNVLAITHWHQGFGRIRIGDGTYAVPFVTAETAVRVADLASVRLNIKMRVERYNDLFVYYPIGEVTE